MNRFFYALLLALLSVNFAQAQVGEIQGKVVNKSDEGIPFANVAVFRNGVLVTGAQTDFDGKYSVSALQPGRYDVEASYQGNKYRITNVIVSQGIVFLDKIKLEEGIKLDDVVIKYEAPLVDKGNTRTGGIVTDEDIKNIPTKQISAIAATTAGVYQEDEGDNSLNIKGSRGDATEYIIDGMRIRGSLRLPPAAIEQLEVITGGVDAKYGDATGGFITVTTKGASKELYGGLELVTSEVLDNYGFNLFALNLTGPLVTKYKGTDTAQATLGYLFSAELLTEKDSDPSATQDWRINDESLAFLQENPIRPSQFGVGFDRNSEFTNMENFEKVDHKINTRQSGASLVGKLDFRLSKSASLTVGANYRYFRSRDYQRTFALYNSENNPLSEQSTYRGYARFTQRFLEKSASEENSSIVGNAYYSIQLDYQKFQATREDERHGQNPFNYGYIGDFKTSRAPVYFYGTDSLSGLNGWLLAGYQDTLVEYTSSDINPVMSNYTTQFYGLSGVPPQSLFDIQLGGGLLNGETTGETVYNMWYANGTPWFNYTQTDDDQYGLNFNAALDLKSRKSRYSSKHSLEFGFEFQQRVQRFYGINPTSLWTIMRQLANRHILNLDISNPYLVIDGETIPYEQWLANGQDPFFGQFDSIYYDRDFVGSDQSYFDSQLRDKLNAMGMNAGDLDFINIDELGPDFFSLDMFSADELLNNGNSLVFYNGFDYQGNKLKSQPTFNDFFTKQDANGNFTREIGAFRPVYVSGYIQDRFNFNDVVFRIGVRVDRYDANRKVLKDPYSLYDIRSAEEVAANVYENTYGSGITTAPGNIGNDFAVYVDDFSSAEPVILGYRDETTWYNSAGEEIADPDIIANASSTNTITPYLVNQNDDIKSSNYDPNSSFEDYQPQVTVMPRIAFSFPISKEEGREALFFAHYDVLTQRPKNASDATPYDYYFFQENAQGVFENPNLRPEKTIDYQVGFQQQISDNSVIKISAFYRELRDMVQVINIPYAYPINQYNTYGNIDFGTIKGLTFNYDLARRTRNLKFNASYTLQFADGTGSNATSQVNLVQANQPNLRTIIPLDYDSRHNIKVGVDYRYGEGEDYDGPRIGKSDFLSNTGVNLQMFMRSGEPYTKRGNPNPDAQFGVQNRPTLEGTLNGSRLPWHFRANVKIDKTWFIEAGKGKGRTVGINAYLWITNIFNNRNVISVYQYSGNADDDGYLASAVGQEAVSQQLDPQSFTDLYNIKIQNPSNFSLPRTIRLGVQVNF